MRERLFLLAFLLVIAASAATPTVLAQENMATVHGTIYDLWTFAPLENVVIEVYSDSTLQIQTVALDGTYSLSFPPGSYTIRASHYIGTALASDAEENITLMANDNVTLDLILFPVFEEENELPENYDILPEFGEAETRSMLMVLVIGLTILVAGAVAFYYVKIHPKKKRAAVEKVGGPPSSVKVVGLPSDLKQVLDVIKESGGRINQVELRKKLPHSEAKVSLMISDLEDRGLIRKIKKGRGNILVLAEK